MRARVAAPLVAALVGIAAGTSTALMTGPEDPAEDGPAAIEDPLGLGIPEVRLDCAPGKGVLVLGFGDTSPPLRAAVAANAAEDLTYVDVAGSCDTTFGPERQEQAPAYAVVLGPYDDLVEPCTVRMEPEHRGDFVTHLQDGNEISVKCVCVLPHTSGPDLRLGMAASRADAVWIRSLQGMLSDVDDETFPKKWITGVYDERTESRVRDYQEVSNVSSPPGVVDQDTWRLLQTRICPRYDF